MGLDKDKKNSAMLAVGIVIIMLAFFIRLNYLSFLTPILSSRPLAEMMLAVTLIMLVRNTIGLYTTTILGGFVVCFIALQQGLIAGLVFFAAVFAFLSLFRLAMQPLHLEFNQQWATLAVIGAIITIIASAFISIKDSALMVFPVVIMAWMADVFVRDCLEQGFRIPAERLFWTVASAAAVAWVSSSEIITSRMLAFPESWLILAALNILLASSDFRLLEYLRFKKYLSYNDVLTVNKRNREYIDTAAELDKFSDKLSMRERLIRGNLPTVPVLAAVKEKRDILSCLSSLGTMGSFVVKPARGSTGKGIVLVDSSDKDGFVLLDENRMSGADMASHIRDILAGRFTISDDRDVAIIEPLLRPAKSLSSLGPFGLPDIRVIVYRGYPVLAMLKVPTLKSGGVANLYKGGIGVAIRISAGRTYSRSKKLHPDTRKRLDGITIPQWDRILSLAVEAQMLSGLSYAGVDIAIAGGEGGKERLFVLEVNRAPGTEIQNISGQGLLQRLRAIDKASKAGSKNSCLSDRINAAKSIDRNFAS